MSEEEDVYCARGDSKPRYLQEWSEVVAGLPTLVVENRARVQAEECEEPDAIFLLLHGYGSNPYRAKKSVENMLDHCFLPPTSLFLQPACAVPKLRYYVPQAPHKVSDEVYGWWKMPNIALVMSLTLTATQKLEQYEPQSELEACRALLYSYLCELQQRHPRAVLILGGFSQGSLVAADLMLSRSYLKQPDILVLMSSTLIEKQAWKREEQLAASTGRPLLSTFIIQTHGYKDRVLQYGEAEQLYQLLSRVNSRSTCFYAFNGGHSMAFSACKYVSCKLRLYLDHWLAGDSSPEDASCSSSEEQDSSSE